jgi:hypothetical protein
MLVVFFRHLQFGLLTKLRLNPEGCVCVLLTS